MVVIYLWASIYLEWCYSLHSSLHFFRSQNIYIVSRTLSTVSVRLLLRHTIVWLLEGPSNPIRHRSDSPLHCPASSIVRSKRRVCLGVDYLRLANLYSSFRSFINQAMPPRQGPDPVHSPPMNELGDWAWREFDLDIYFGLWDFWMLLFLWFEHYWFIANPRPDVLWVSRPY